MECCIVYGSERWIYKIHKLQTLYKKRIFGDLRQLKCVYMEAYDESIVDRTQKKMKR